ncbi:MAG: excinuclease ABC subunit UvrB, partial [Acidimicrobiales bacterium]|nr:excinuclease ABC subunit UvrB [Acidimicrobiales bacterium]
MPPFEVVSEFTPAGDQPTAIAELTEGLSGGERFQTLLGITGSGKSATIAWTIEQVQRPTLVIAPNKSLAAQLANEFREFFPNNAVEYFVSYYDYYQPEAYMPSSDTYIEKDSSVNDEIDRLRHSATAALLTRRDVIVVASVSCIYGLGAPDEYRDQLLVVRVGEEHDQRSILRRLVDMQYERNDMNLVRGKFRVRGDTIEIHPAYEETAIRVELFGDEIEAITVVDPLTGEKVRSDDELILFPATHYVAGDERMRRAIGTIETELQERLAELESQQKLLEAQRLRMRTQYDLEMMQEMGYCNGIENYSRHIDGRDAGEAPYTLLDYFPDDFVVVIDESHVAVPQIHGQYEGDRSRKLTLIEHGFRLPSAADNRPLRFEEWEERVKQCVFMSATPADYELRKSSQVVEQIVRPTGLVDPEIQVKPTKGQIDDLIEQINKETALGNRVLVTTLTKKMAEDLTDYLVELGVRVRYLHSNIDTIERIEILRGLRLGDFDVLVGINLLREGLDLPEVTLVAILDADKEGFLRSETSLVQTVGRAARNVDGRVIMYADQMTDSMRRTIDLTQRRRKMQQEYNAEHGINPQTVRKAVTDILAYLRKDEGAPVPNKLDSKAIKREREVGKRRDEVADLPHADLERLIRTLEDEMNEAAADLRFEYA